MKLFSRMRRKLHNAIRPAPSALAPNVLRLPVATGRASVHVLRVREIDGPTISLPRPGDPGVNTGQRYNPRVARHRAPDTNVVPARFTRQQVA